MNPGRFWMLLIALAASLSAHAAPVTNAPFPPTGFPGGRYTALWTKSPFAIATPDAAPESADYSLVGVAQFDGVSYASLIDKQANEHFVLASDKPVRNLKLISISKRPDGTLATVLHNGDTLTLKLENAAPSEAAATPNLTAGNSPTLTNSGVIFPNYGAPPPVRFHHPHIVVPGRPQ